MARPCEIIALGSLIDHTRKAEKSRLIWEFPSASALYRLTEASFTVFPFLRKNSAEMKVLLDLSHLQALKLCTFAVFIYHCTPIQSIFCLTVP